MGNSTSNTSPQGKGSESVSSERKPSRLSLNKSLQSTASQNREAKVELSSQVDSCLREKYIRGISFSMPAADVSRDEIITGYASVFKIETASNTTNPVSAVTTEDTKLTMSDTGIIVVSDSDTSTDDSTIVIRQTSVSNNEHSRSNTTYDNNVHAIPLERSRIHFDSRTRLDVSQICNTSGDNCNSTTSYTQNVNTQKDCHNVSDTRECNNVIASTSQRLDTKMNSVPSTRQIAKHNPKKPKREPNKTLPFGGDNSFSNKKDEKMSRDTTNLQENAVHSSFSEQKKSSLKNESLLNTPDTDNLAKSLIKNWQSKRLSIEKLIKASISSLPKKLSSNEEQTIVISDEEAGEPNDKQPVWIYQKQKSDPHNKTSVLNRNPSASSLRRHSTIEYSTETKQNGEHKKVADSLSSNSSFLSDIQNAFSAFTRSSSNCSLSQEIPYQGEDINQRLNQIHDNPEPAVPILVATSSNASTRSMPSLQRRPSSFYENELCEEHSPPLLSQQPVTSLTSSEKSYMINVCSINSKVNTTDNSFSVSENKKEFRLFAREHCTETDMYTESSIPLSEHSEDSLHGKITDILDMLNTADVNVEDQDSVGKIQMQYNFDESKAEKVSNLSVQQHEPESSGITHFSVGIVGSAGRSSCCDLDLAIVKKEEDSNAFTDVGNVYMYSEINDEVYVLDSDDDDFFMSQSVLSTTIGDEKESGQRLNSKMEKIPIIDANDKYVEPESNSENSLAFKQLNKCKETSVLVQSCFKEVDSLRVVGVDDDTNGSDIEDLNSDTNGSDIEDLNSDTNGSDIEDLNSDTASKDAYFSNNYDGGNDNSIMKNKSSELINIADDHIAESVFDDDDVFLSQVDYVDDSYFAHTQVDYMACSDEELKQGEDGAECDNFSDSVKDVSNKDRTNITSDSVEKVKQHDMEPSNFDNTATACTVFTSDDTQDPFCRETQVCVSPLLTDQENYKAALVSLDEDTQCPDNIDTHNTADVAITTQKTLARPSSPDLGSLFGMTTEAHFPSKLPLQFEVKVHTVSPLLNEYSHGSADTKTKRHSKITGENQDPFERETLASSLSNDLEYLYNMATQKDLQSETGKQNQYDGETQKDLQSETGKQNQYDGETQTYSSSSEDSSSTQKDLMPETICKKQHDKKTYTVPVSLNEDTQNPTVTEAEENSRVASNNNDPFKWMTLEASPKEDMESLYNMSTQKIIDMPEIEKSNKYDRETFKLSVSSSEDSDCFLTMATQTSVTSETEDKPYGKATLPVSTSINEDKQNPVDTETMEHSQTSPIKDLDNLYSIATQKMCVPQIKDHEPYDRETLAVSLSPFEDSEFMFSTETQKSSNTKALANEETYSLSSTQDTQDPFSTDTAFSELQNQGLECKETVSFLSLLTRDRESNFYAHTQKDILLAVDHSSRKKELAVVCAPPLEDDDSINDSSEDSQTFFSRKTKDSSSLFTVHDVHPYDVQTIIMSSSLTEDTQDPFDIETLIDSPSEAKDYETETLTSSSPLQQNNRDPIIVEKVVSEVSLFLNKDNENHYLIMTQRNVPDLRPCDKEINNSSKEQILSCSEEESQDSYLLPTQVDYPQDTKDVLTSTPVEVTQANPVVKVHKYFQSALNKHKHSNTETNSSSIPSSSEYKQNRTAAPNLPKQDSCEVHQSNQSTNSSNIVNLSSNLLQSFKRSKQLLNKSLSKLFVASSHEMSTLTTKFKDESVTQNLEQSPYFMKIKKDLPIVREPDPNVTEASASVSPNRDRMKSFFKLIDPSSDDMKPCIKFSSSEQSHQADKTATNRKTPAESSRGSEEHKYTPSSIPINFLGVSPLSHAQDRAPLKDNDERNLFSDQEEVLHKHGVKGVNIHDPVGTSSASLKNNPLARHSFKHPKGEAFSSHKNNVSFIPSERYEGSSSSLKRHAVQEKEISAKRKCIKKVDNNKPTSSSKETARKRQSKDTELNINLKRVKVTSVAENSPGSLWTTVNKGENTDKSKNKCRSITNNFNTNKRNNNFNKPKRSRFQSSEKTKSPSLNIQVEKAKQLQQRRFINSKSAMSDYDKRTKSSTSDVHDDNNDDVEMPSTQDMMKLGLPILNAKLPVSKKHLARGLPSQGRVASEEKDIHNNYFQLPSERALDNIISMNIKKSNNEKETLPPVPIFNLTTADHCTTSHAADTSLPAHLFVTSETCSSSITSFSGSKVASLGQSLIKNTYHQISESDPNKQPQTVMTFVSHSALAPEITQTTIPMSAQLVVSVNSSDLANSTHTLHPEGINFQGHNLQTLPAHSRTKDTPSICNGILKTSELYPVACKTRPKVKFSNTNSEAHSFRSSNHTLPLADVLQLKESAKPKPEAKLYFLSTILNWNPLWLNERETIQSLPELFGSQKKIKDVCSQLRLFYSTFHEYVDVTLNLLVLECWETIFRDWKMHRSPEASVTLEVHCVQNQNHPTESDRVYSLLNVDVIGLAPLYYRRKIPLAGDFLIIDFWGARKIQGKYKEPRLCKQFALVKSVEIKSTDIKQFLETHKIFEKSPVLKDRNPQLVYMKLLLRNKGDIITPTILHTIKVISSLKIITRQIDALINLPDNPLCVPILKPCDKAVFYHHDVQPDDHLCDKLNREQATAIATILRDVVVAPSTQKVFLLQGPPGTGKSHTILALIHQILVKTHFKARICLATPSNAAVDEIAKRIINFSQQLEKKGLQNISLVRVGNSNKVQLRVKEFMWEELVNKKLFRGVPESLRIELNSLEQTAQTLRESLSNPSISHEQKVMKSRKQKEVEAKIVKLKADIAPKKGNSRERYKAKCQILDEAHVICGTLSSFGSDDLKDIVLRKEENCHKRIPFTCLIIDEATQAIEVDCLIPLQYKMSKVVLVGDHEQLPATVLSQIASDKCLARSLFERVIECSKTTPAMMLTRQYRMHKEILYLPNSFFYDCKLDTDESVLIRREVIAPYLVFNIQASRETRDQNNRSVSNLDEAICTAQLCEIVKQKINSIGVICPYAEQQHEIIRCLSQRKLDVEVNTVDSFQGQERDVIILSCVRAQSNPTGIGFLADRKRMNVALTRAKLALYVIGHFDTLCTDELWKELYRNATERKLVVKVTKTADFKQCAESAVLKRRQFTA